MFKTLVESVVLGFKSLVENVFIEGYFSREKESPPSLPKKRIFRVISQEGDVHFVHLKQ